MDELTFSVPSVRYRAVRQVARSGSALPTTAAKALLAFLEIEAAGVPLKREDEERRDAMRKAVVTLRGVLKASWRVVLEANGLVRLRRVRRSLSSWGEDVDAIDAVLSALSKAAGGEGTMDPILEEDEEEARTGWKLTPSWICPSDELYLSEVEAGVVGFVRKRDYENSARAVTELRNAIVDMPPSLWLARPAVLLTLLDVVKSPTTPTTLRRSALKAVLAIAAGFLGPALDLALDPSVACEDPAAFFFRQADRATQAQLEQLHARHIPPRRKDFSGQLAVAGACALIFRAAAPVAARSGITTAEKECQAIASELLLTVSPFLVEPPPAPVDAEAEEEEERVSMAAAVAFELDDQRVPSCLAALEDALSDDEDASVLAVRLCCSMRRTELPPRLDSLARNFAVDARTDPLLRDAASALIDPAVAAEAAAAMNDAAVAFKLLREEKYDSLNEAIFAAAAAMSTLQRLPVHDESDDASLDDFRTTLLYADDDDESLHLRALKALRSAPAAPRLDYSVIAATLAFAVGILADESSSDEELLGKTLSLLVELLERNVISRRLCCEALLGRATPTQLVSSFVREDNRQLWFSTTAIEGVAITKRPWRNRLYEVLASEPSRHVRSQVLRIAAESADPRTKDAARLIVSRLISSSPLVGWTEYDSPWLQIVLEDSILSKREGLIRSLFSRETSVRRQATSELLGDCNDSFHIARPTERSQQQPCTNTSLREAAEEFTEAFNICKQLDYEDQDRKLSKAARSLYDSMLRERLDDDTFMSSFSNVIDAVSSTDTPHFMTSAGLRVILATAWSVGPARLGTEGLLDATLDALLSRLARPEEKIEEAVFFNDGGDRACAAVALAILVFDARGWQGDGDAGNIFNVVFQNFDPPSGDSLWGDHRLAWKMISESSTFTGRNEEEDPTVREAGCRAASSQLSVSRDEFALPRHLAASDLCTRLTTASNRSQFCHRLVETYNWLVCHGAVAEILFAKANWQSALERPLSSLPRGRDERRALRYAVLILVTVANRLNADDERWGLLWEATLGVVVPASLDPSYQRRHGTKKDDDEDLDDDVATACCTLLAIVADRQPRLFANNSSGQLLTAYLTSLLSASPSPRVNSVALVVLDKLLEHASPVKAPLHSNSALLMLAQNSDDDLKRRSQLDAISSLLRRQVRPRDPSDAFRGFGSLKRATRCLLRTLCVGATALDEASAALLGALALDRDADVRTSALTLTAEALASSSFGDSVASKLREQAALIAGEPSEAPACRGAAMALLARTTTHRTSLASSAAATSTLFREFPRDNSFFSPTFWLGSAKLCLALASVQDDRITRETREMSNDAFADPRYRPMRNSSLEVAARGLAALIPYATLPNYFHENRYVLDVRRCAGIDLIAARANASATHPALRAWVEADYSMLAGEGWTSVAQGRWRSHANDADEVAVVILRCARVVLSKSENSTAASALANTNLFELAGASLRSNKASIFAEAAELIADYLNLDDGSLVHGMFNDEPMYRYTLRSAVAVLSLGQTASVAQTAAACRLVHAVMASTADLGREDDSLVESLSEACVATVEYLESSDSDDVDTARYAASHALAKVVDSSSVARSHILRPDRPFCPLSRAVDRLARATSDLTLVQKTPTTTVLPPKPRRSDVVAAARALVVVKALLLNEEPGTLHEAFLLRGAETAESVAQALEASWQPLSDAVVESATTVDPLDSLVGAVTNLACGDDESKRVLKKKLAHRLMELTLHQTNRRRPQSLSRDARIANGAAACLRVLASSPSRSVLLQGSYIGDVIVILRRLAAAAAAPALGIEDRGVEVTARRAAKSRALELLRLLVSATMYADAQKRVLDHQQTPELLLDLVHYYGPESRSRSGGSHGSPTSVAFSEKRRRRDDAALEPQFVAFLLRNLSLLRRNKGRFLAQTPLLDFLVGALGTSKSPALLTAAASALWSLLHHSEKARALVKSDARATKCLDAASRHMADIDDDRSRLGQRAILAISQILAGADILLPAADEFF